MLNEFKLYNIYSLFAVKDRQCVHSNVFFFYHSNCEIVFYYFNLVDGFCVENTKRMTPNNPHYNTNTNAATAIAFGMSNITFYRFKC